MRVCSFVCAAVASVLTAGAADFPIGDFGASNDGQTDVAFAIQRAIDAAAAVGGGCVQVVGGTFRSGPVRLKDGVELRIGENCVLRGGTVLADGVRDVAITGPGELVEGSVRFAGCTGVKVEGLTIRRAIDVACSFADCSKIGIGKLKVWNGLGNRVQGLVFDACRQTEAEDCQIETGGNVFTLCCSAADGACEDVRIRKAICRTDAAAVRLGEGTGVIRRLCFDKVKVLRAKTALKVGTGCGERGSDVSQVRFADVDIQGSQVPVGVFGGDAASKTRISDVSFVRMTGEAAERPFVGSRGGVPPDGILFDDCEFYYDGNGPAELRLESVGRIEQKEVRLVRRGGAADGVFLGERVTRPVRLNNFVTVIREDALAEGDFEIELPHDGWLFFAARSSDTRSVEIRLDGEVALDGTMPNLESFRETTGGRHRVSVKGGSGRFAVRRISEIMVHSAEDLELAENRLPEGVWPTFRRLGLPTVTTVNDGDVPAADWEMFRRTGHKRLVGVPVLRLKSDDEFEKRLASSGAMTDPKFDGGICDEMIFGLPVEASHQPHFCNGMRAYESKRPPERKLYTWCANDPGLTDLNSNIIATAVSVRGGKLVHEYYVRTMVRNEVEAMRHFITYGEDYAERCRAMHPFPNSAFGCALGAFWQSAKLSVVHDPTIDGKRFIEQALRYLATDRYFDDLGLVGYWGLRFGNIDGYRWFLKILRHYCIEGRNDLMSPRYGFRYRPGHVLNPDFTKDFSSWTVEGDVTRDSAKGFASASEGRWTCASYGNTFAVFHRRAGATNALVQVARGLEPGRDYILGFMTADYHDVLANRYAPRNVGIRVRLGDGAAIVPQETWTCVDRLNYHPGQEPCARVNVHQVRFTAKSPELALRFDDAEARPGEDLVLNGVSLNPCYEEEKRRE